MGMIKINAITAISKLILKLNPMELTALAIVIGYLFTEGLDAYQVQSIGNFFELIGQTIITYGTQMENINEDNNNNKSIGIEDAILILKNKIGNIEKIITELKK